MSPHLITTYHFLLKCVVAVVMASAVSVLYAEVPMPFERTIAIAQEYDPWLSGSRYQEQAIEAQGIAAGQLPDPVMSLGFSNLPVDSFDLDQEPMTQLKVAVSQAFPRGDTRALSRQQWAQRAAQHPYMRQDRQARVTAIVSQLWLEIFRNRESIRLIEKDRILFEYLVDLAESSYTSTLGRTRQQDLVRAQLELTRLEDRLSVLQQRRETALAQLGAWLPDTLRTDFVISGQLPVMSLASPVSAELSGDNSRQWISALLAHPRIKSFDQKIAAMGTGIQLARQTYLPQWGINASYGYRDDAPLGDDRSDFLSLGVTFDVPLFAANRQDKVLQAAVANEQAVKTEKILLLREMRADLEAAHVRLQRLEQRKMLYEKRLLREIHDQAEASLSAYTSDDGDFAEVARARIAELNANIDFLDITIDRLKTIAELNYFFAQVKSEQEEGGHL